MSNRIALTDATGRWFDPDKAEHWDEDRRWDGNNHVSVATGSQWDHEELYRTAGGRWILHSWSQWQGSTPSYLEIDAGDAARWLAKNEHEPPDECAAEFAALEIS